MGPSALRVAAIREPSGESAVHQYAFGSRSNRVSSEPRPFKGSRAEMSLQRIESRNDLLCHLRSVQQLRTTQMEIPIFLQRFADNVSELIWKFRIKTQGTGRRSV